MDKIFFAPVPCVHMPDALDVFDREGRVAFGSGDVEGDDSGVTMWKFFSDQWAEDTPIGVPGLIYVSGTGVTERCKKYFKPTEVAYKCILDKWIRSPNNKGLHPDPRLRPKSTLEGYGQFAKDGKSAIFWEITNLIHLGQPIAMSQLFTENRKPINPRRPQLVNLAIKVD